MEKGFVLHWDGKMMKDIKEQCNVERLPIVGSQSDMQRILNVPKLRDKTAEAATDAIYDTIIQYNLHVIVQAVCSDTENTNTGSSKGVIKQLEKRLGHDLLYLACRHHVYEIILKAVFTEKCELNSKSPSVEIFNRLKSNWNNINTNQFKSGLEDDFVQTQIDPDCSDEMLEFCLDHLQKPQCRVDYREFLQLVVLFLGGRPPGVNKLKKPGAIHHARWMAKAIGALKIFLLREQFEFKDNEYNGIRDVCIFLIRLYVKAWFQTKSAIDAPRIDLDFIKESIHYANIDNEVSNVILSKIRTHLWYLSEEAIGFAFYDSKITVEEKSRMVSALNKQEKSKKKLEPTLTQLKSSYKSKEIHDFISINTKKLFDRFCLPTGFLSVDPSHWGNNEDFKKGLEVCQKVHVVNDTAERAVKLFSEYNEIFTQDEDLKQCIIKSIQFYKDLYPSVNKSQLE